MGERDTREARKFLSDFAARKPFARNDWLVAFCFIG